MKAVIVDDERLACMQLVKMLEPLNVFESIKSYSDPDQALAEEVWSSDHVAFLDIAMPGMSGIELAEHLQNQVNAVNVVFTTAYNEFAVQAFELNAIDYLLKPFTKERLKKTIDRLLTRKHDRHEPDGGARAGIECFESLKFYKIAGGEKMYLSVKWRTNKARELYLYLLANHDRFVSKDVLMELLWPDSDPSKANTHLYTAIYQIRRISEQLPIAQAIVKNEVGYSLNIGSTPLDYELWQKQMNELPPLSAGTLAAHLRLFHLYTGHYLANDGYLWAEQERFRLSERWHRHTRALIRFLVDDGRNDQALDVCLHVSAIEPDDEETIKSMINIYNQTGNISGSIRLYQQYKQRKI
ncbi:MAG: response regulator [Sporolactobacillus sp.]